MIGPKEESHIRGGCPSLHEERPLLQRRWTSKSPHHKGWYRTSEEESSSADVVVRIHGVDVVKPGRKSTRLSTRATKKYVLSAIHRRREIGREPIYRHRSGSFDISGPHFGSRRTS